MTVLRANGNPTMEFKKLDYSKLVDKLTGASMLIIMKKENRSAHI